MSMSKVQRAISEIAYKNWNEGNTMTILDLAKELDNMGIPHGNGRGLYKQISSAYNQAINESNQGIADCIANCFTNNNGNYCWKPY